MPPSGPPPEDQLVLAVETATIEVGVALAAPGGLLAEVRARPGRRHAETLHPALEEVCRLAGVALSEVGAVAVDVGPGLFTGLRVGVAAAKGLAFALGRGLIGVSSLEILAAGTPSGPSCPVVPVVDVRRGEIAWALPERHLAVLGPASSASSGSPPAVPARPPLGQPRLGSSAELRAELAELLEHLAPPGGLVLVGDGARRYGGDLAGERVQVAGDSHAAPRAAVLAELALDRGEAADPATVVPLYLRAAEAAINWTTRHGAAAAYDS